MAESYQIYLNSKYADTQNNDSYKFQLNTLDVQEGYYIYLSVQNVSIPYSFYNVNESNNKIEYIIFTQLYTVLFHHLIIILISLLNIYHL